MTNAPKTQSNPQDSDPVFYTQDGFADEAKTFHGFFSRRGGVSKDIYASLNCGVGSNDEPENVAENRANVALAVGCDPENLMGVHQVHSAECVAVSENWGGKDRPKADALATDVPGLAVSVLTADCTPVLLYGEKDGGASVVAAAHAGWGGALGGVLEDTLKKMEDLGASIESVRAAIGPCISQASYEVSEDFAEPFLKEDETSEKFFKSAHRAGHLMFDLPGYCAFRLARAGVKQVSIKDLDTYFNEEDFFSYRRTTHRHEKDYGRQISVIMIKDE